MTTVELLPVHTFINDDFLLQKKLSNYWGYNSSGLFAPDPRYASNPAKCLKEPTRITRNDDLGRSAGQPARKG